MKNIIAIALALICFYPKIAVVKEISKETDQVMIEDPNGYEWVFEGIEDYEIGDVVAMIMSNNGTNETIFDDEIVDIRYSGLTL